MGPAGQPAGRPAGRSVGRADSSAFIIFSLRTSSLASTGVGGYAVVIHTKKHCIARTFRAPLVAVFFLRTEKPPGFVSVAVGCDAHTTPLSMIGPNIGRPSRFLKICMFWEPYSPQNEKRKPCEPMPVVTQRNQSPADIVGYWLCCMCP